MENFKKRLIKEKKELGAKIASLHTFLYSQKFMNLDDKNKTLLREQYKVMNQYYNILLSRLELIITEDDINELNEKKCRRAVSKPATGCN